MWPEKDVVVTSPQLSLDEYLDRASDGPLSEDDVIGIMVGDLQRIRVYPGKGFQISQEIPPAGYDRYLIR